MNSDGQMKLNFLNLVERQTKGLLFLFSLFLLPLVAMATDPTYSNSGSINNANLPQVDATNFYNSGSFGTLNNPIITTSPYTTSHTLNYTNVGTMYGSVGWEFDYGPSASGRGMSANFFNGNGATIQAEDGVIANPELIADFLASYLLVSATNIVNQGTLIAGGSGEIVLTGTNINLSRSGLEITPITPQGSMNSSNTFTPDIAIYDEFWLGGTNTFTVNGSPWDGTTIGTFTGLNAGVPCGTTTIQIGPLTPQVADSYTTNLNPYILVTTNMGPMGTTTMYPLNSNIVRQAVFVAVSDPNISAADHFSPALAPTNFFKTVAVRFTMASTNVVTQAPQTGTLYLVDDLASSTNQGLLTNVVINPEAACTGPTARPSSVVVSRSDPILSIGPAFASGAPGLGKPTNTFFYDPSFSNTVATGIADAYSALVDNLASEVPAGGSITNVPGRIQIYADNLDLTKTRMDDEGAEITIVATNLIGSAGAAISCQNLSYNLGSTAGFLNFTNLAVPSVSRLQGTVDEWSGVWTNYIVTEYPNYDYDMVTSNYDILDPVTNTTEVDLAITVVDATGLSSLVPVTVQNLVLNSTNMVISDSMSIGQSLLLEGQSLTLQGNLNLSGVPNWVYTEAPTLLYFTNNGVLTVPNDAHFGDDGPTNYIEFVNNGTISAGSQRINSVDYQNTGSQSASGGLFLVTASSGKVEGGTISSGQDVDFNAGTLKLNNSTITAGGELYFNVTNSLFDAGGSSGNVLTCNEGFDLPIKPVTGDLIGTELETITPTFAAVGHYWSGLDFGVSSAGYTNNEAVGQLVLKEGSGSEFLFHATGSSNAMYVDLLDLSQCPDFLDPDVLTIDSNFVIYFAAAKLPPSFTVPPNANGIPQEPEEFLNGQQNGHLRWVGSFAGPNSSVAVLVNGQTVQVNRALRYSKTIDSNGNGIPNYYDTNPFDNPPFSVSAALAQTNQPPSKTFAISWTAVSNTVYEVDYRPNLVSGVWQPLLSYTNSASTNVSVTIWDTNLLSGQRFYRVSHPWIQYQ